MYPLISAEEAYNGDGGTSFNASMCESSTLVESKVKGKIVLCHGDPSADETVKATPAAGTIMSVDVAHDTAFTTLLPATIVPAKIGNIIGDYINTTRSPQAIIHKTVDVATTAPIVASFSSRGPQTIAKYILKPDISAPGIGILAGYSKLVSSTDFSSNMDDRYDYFNIMSGTSMATPHVAGAAAYVKTHHPDWSPAAIKSALMTTAKPVNGTGSEDPLSTGSGLISPIDALNPGLIYNLAANDYIRYLCKEGYNGSVTDDTPNSVTGFLEWNNESNKHRVRSPILIYRPTVTY